MRSAKVILATSLLFAFAASGRTGSAEEKMRLYPPESGGICRVITSGDIRLAVDDIDGRFTIGTTDGKSLLFGFPSEGATSHANFLVGDSVAGTYTDDGGLHPDPARVLLHPVAIGDAIVSRYEIDGIQFEQRLTPTILGENSSVFIEYTATNTTASAVDVGLLLFLDTMIGGNDYAPIATEYGYFAVEREFVAPDIPMYWQAFESSPWQPEDSLIGAGVLIGGSASPPDRVVYGDFWHFHDVEWDYTVSGDPYSDSAVLLRWDARPLSPGETRRMSTYYGLGDAEIVVGDLNLSLSAPEELTIESCSFRTPNPFPVNLIVSNGTAITLGGLSARIDLPEGFHVDGGSSIVDLAPDVLSSGATGTVSWLIAVDDSMFGDDTTVCFDVSAWASATDTFSVEWCIDIPGIDGRGATAELMAPADGATIACDTVALMFRIGDPGEIDASTIELTVDGLHLSYPDFDRMSFSDPFLTCLIPSSELTEGEVNIALGDIHDRDGCPLIADYEWRIHLDWHPPVATVLTPSSGDTMTSEDFEVVVSLTDLSGIEDSSLFWTINGTRYGAPVTFDDSIASIRPASTGLLPLGLSPCEVCLGGIHDRAYGHCGPNAAPPACIEFYTDIERPYAQIIEPVPGAWVSCARQAISAKLVNPGGGIDPATVFLDVDGTEYTIADAELSLEDTILTFVPSVSFSDGDEVDLLLRAGSFGGMDITPLSWSFHVDLSAPTVEPLSPAGGEFSSPEQPISFVVSDAGAGVDISTFDLTIVGPDSSFDIAAGSPWLSVSGDTFLIYPSDIDLGLIGCSPISVEIDIADLARGCGPNLLSGFSWGIDVPCTPPVQGPPSVPEYSYVSCETLSIRVYLHDDEGIDTSSMAITVNGFPVALGSDYAHIGGDSLFFDLPRAVFGGDSVVILVDDVVDLFRNPLAEPIDLIYYWDDEPPRIENPLPDTSEFLSELPDWFSVGVHDDAAGLDMSLSFMSFNGYRIMEDAGLDYDGSRLSAPTGALEPFDGETLRVCVYAVDSAIACGANVAFSCWNYLFDRGSPTAQLVSPPPDAVIGCVDQRFEFYIFDEQGIDPSSIVLGVCEDSFDLSDSELSFAGCTLAFSPDSGYFSHGSECNISLLDAADSSGNHIASPVGGNFAFDFEPPSVDLVSPEETLLGPLQSVVWEVDDPSGIDPASILLECGGATYSLADPALSLDGTSLVFDPAMGWDSDVELRLHVADLAFGCPNEQDFIFSLTYDPATPSIIETSPSTDAFVACNPITLKALLRSSFGIILADARVSCDTIVLAYPDGIELLGDTLFARFAEGSVSEGRHEFSITGLRDTLGNLFPDKRFGATLDFEPPHIGVLYPLNGSNVQGDGLVVSARVSDDLSGVDLDRISLTLDGMEYHLDSPYLQLLGDSLALDASELGLDGAVHVEVAAFDKTSSCGPNSASVGWDFSVNSQGPAFELLEPFDGAITHIENQPIRIRFADSDGLDLGATSITVGGVPYNAADLALDGDTIEFQPDFEWQSGRRYDISISGEDVLGNRSSASLGGFVTDFDPPEIVECSPRDNDVLENPPDRIWISIADSISGFDPNSFEIVIDGRAYSAGDVGVVADSASISIDLLSAGIRLGSPDSVTVVLQSAADYPGDYGSANVMEEAFVFAFTVVDEGCVAVPRPFTPNADGFYDDVTIFTGLPETAIIKLWNIDGRPVREVRVDGKWRWDGTDDAGRPMPPGLYMFSVSRASNGKTYCSGTAVLAR